jgi:hypothetical protein
MEAIRQGVQQEAPDELVGCMRHHLDGSKNLVDRRRHWVEWIRNESMPEQPG